MIARVIQLLTFIPWILYYIEIMLYRITIIEGKECDREKYFKYLNKNFFNSFNVKELVLFCIFVIFMQWNNTTVLEILFPAIYIYLLINFFHSLANKCKKITDKWLMIDSVILLVVLIIYFLISGHLFATYILMFASSLLSSFIIYLFSLTRKKSQN